MKIIQIIPTLDESVIQVSISNIGQKGDKNTFLCPLEMISNIIKLNIK